MSLRPISFILATVQEWKTEGLRITGTHLGIEDILVEGDMVRIIK